MRIFLRPKILSHGTPLGYLGPGIQGDVWLGFSQPQFLVIWGLYDPPSTCGFSGNRQKSENIRVLVCHTYMGGMTSFEVIYFWVLITKKS